MTNERIQALELSYADLKRQLDTIAAQMETIKQEILAEYNNTGISKYTGSTHQFSVISGGNRISVDSSKLKNEFPDVYIKVLKTTSYNPSVRFEVLK